MPLCSVSYGQDTSAYLTDNAGRVVKSGFGLCIRNSSWTPQSAIKECDPDLVKSDIPKKEIVVIKEEIKEQIQVQVNKQPVSILIKAFFDFDKSELSLENKEKLKEIAEKMKHYNIEVITVSGHADRIGTEKYNQKLSEKRAAVVKAELVRLGIDESKIYTEAKGESQPEVTCLGHTSAKLILCLAPNRRVQVEVIGSVKKE